MTVQLGFGIVGCGGAAVDVVAAIDALPGARLAAVFDASTERAADLAAGHDAHVLPSLAALVEHPDVHVVYVGLPHDLLAATVRVALEAGRHVLAEKPLALDAETARELGRLARAGGQVLGVLFEFRSSAPVVAARRLVQDGAVGRLRMVRITTVIDKPPSYWSSGPSGRAQDPWRTRRARAGGGVVLMNAIHQLDVVRAVTGREVTRVAGDIATFTPGIEVEDAAGGVMRLDDGALLTITAAAHSPGAESQERIELDGDLGRLDLPYPYGTGSLRRFPATDGARRWEDASESSGEAHRRYLEAFCAAVERNAEPPAGADDAAAALDIVLALYRSAASGRAIDLAGDASQPEVGA